MNKLLPVFMKLEGSNCLVVGGGKIAFQKIKQLVGSSAKVIVIAPEISESIKTLPVGLINRKYKTQSHWPGDNQINHSRPNDR